MALRPPWQDVLDVSPLDPCFHPPSPPSKARVAPTHSRPVASAAPVSGQTYPRSFSKHTRQQRGQDEEE